MDDIDRADVARELDKAADALEAAYQHLRAKNESDAALHLAGTVRYSPLTQRVQAGMEDARKAAQRFYSDGGIQ